MASGIENVEKILKATVSREFAKSEKAEILRWLYSDTAVKIEIEDATTADFLAGLEIIDEF